MVIVEGHLAIITRIRRAGPATTLVIERLRPQNTISVLLSIGHNVQFSRVEKGESTWAPGRPNPYSTREKWGRVLWVRILPAIEGKC